MSAVRPLVVDTLGNVKQMADADSFANPSWATVAVPNIASLLAIVPTATATIMVAGYRTPGDSGGGAFAWDATRPSTDHNGGTVISPNNVFPSVWNDDAQMKAWFTASSGNAGCWVRQDTSLGVFDVQHFGGTPDGVTDNYYSIQAAIAAVSAHGTGSTFKLGGGGIYYIDKYKISTPDNGVRDFKFVNLPDLVIDGCGSMIQLKGGWTRTADASSNGQTFSYSDSLVFHVERCDNFILRDIHIDGGADTITKQATAEGYCHNIVVAGCDKGLISNVKATHSLADGLILTSSGSSPFIANTFITVINSKFTRNARQGCTVVQARWVNFVGCEFSYTGASGKYGGHPPQGGVTIEPDASGANGAGNESTGDITFTGCIFKDNVGYAYVGANRETVPHPIRFFGCSFINSMGTADTNPYLISASRNTLFSGCNFDDMGLLPGYTFDNDNSTVVRDSVFRWSLPTHMMLMVSANAQLNIDTCKLYFTSPIARTEALMLLRGIHAVFRNNYVFLAGSAIKTSTTYDFPFQLESMYLANNMWDTDLNSGNTTAVVSVSNSKVENDNFLHVNYFSTWIGGYPYGSTYAAGTTKFDVLESALGTTYREGNAAPTAGTWKVGDKVFNSRPTDQGFIGWTCVVAGTPGTWIPFGAISSILPSKAPALVTTTSDGLMSATDKLKLDKCEPLAFGTTAWWAATGNSTAATAIGVSVIGTGTATEADVALTNVHTATKRLEYAVTTADTGAVAGLRQDTAQYALGDPTKSYGGFTFMATFGLSRGKDAGTSRRMFAGMTSTTAAPTDTDPSSLIADAIGVGADSSDSNWQIMHRSGTDTMTKIDTGFSKNDDDATQMYTLRVLAPLRGGQDVVVRFTRLSDGKFFEQEITTGLPALTQLLAWQIYTSVGGTSSVIGVAVSNVYIKTQ
jgi:hypothetical protein